MDIVRPSPGVIVFERPDQGANASLIQTAKGMVVIDTTSCPADMQALLDAVDVSPADVCLVINTHSHSDHTWGNQLFDCPILAHEVCRETMAANMGGPWNLERIRAEIAERRASEDPADRQWAKEMQKKIEGLEIRLPTQCFQDRRDLVVGGVEIQVVHLDAHTPGSIVVWTPQTRTLWAGDLIFEGRYPFIGDADIPEWISLLTRLPNGCRLSAFGAETVVPGHGRLCTEATMTALGDYLHGTWSRTIDHLAQGHSADEAASDPGYPRYAEGAAERYHENNIRLMYAVLAGNGECPL
jgi:glyoxylase-like metal-dependent hydrolase (beta-lactamase superfamily II)